MHNSTGKANIAPLIRQLVQGNWIRTVLWTANALFLLVWTAQ